MDETDVFQRLQKSYRDKFWMMLFSDMEEIEKSVNKYLSVKNITTDRWDDFKEELWLRCLCKYPSFNAAKSDFKTWVMWKARGLMRDVLRKPKKSAPIFWELTFTDILLEREYEGSEGEFSDREWIASPEEQVGISDEPIKVSRELERELVQYAQLLGDDPGMGLRLKVLQELCLSCWDISDREIARHLGMSHPWIGKERRAIVAELRIRLSRVDFPL